MLEPGNATTPDPATKAKPRRTSVEKVDDTPAVVPKLELEKISALEQQLADTKVIRSVDAFLTHTCRLRRITRFKK